MRATIETISPQGYAVRIEVEAADLETLLKQLPDVEITLAEAGYAPAAVRPATPDGLPICPRHGLPMKQRERQGDKWFSHRIVGPNGQELWCKGRPGVDSPGWEV